MYIVGCFYNLCDFHRSLRIRLWVGHHGYRWVQRTPAMAAGLADHRWTVDELLTFRFSDRRNNDDQDYRHYLKQAARKYVILGSA